MRIRYRLAAFFFIVVAVVSLTMLVLVRYSAENLFRSFVFSGDADKARIYATILGDYYSEKKGWGELQSFLSEIPRLVFSMIDQRIHGERGAAPIASYPYDTISALMSDRIVVADLSGLIVADTSGKLIGTIHPAMHLAHGVPIMSDFRREGTVLVGSMVDSSLTGINERFLGSIMVSLLWATLASGAIAFVLGLAFTSRINRPIAALTSAVRRVAAGDLSAAVIVEGRDEMSELSISFNAMTEELKRLEEAKRQIIADSAHELRTPLTLIQGTIEAMIDGVYPLDIATLKGVHDETLRLSRLIDMLRELELIESGELALELQDIDILELAEKALPFFAAAAKEKGLRLELARDPGPLPRIRGDYLRLGEVVYNLLSNAVKYTPAGGRVRLRATPGQGAGRLLFHIEDSGAGIPAEERERVFERFYRMDKSRAQDSGGQGLGLAIAREIVKAHGGSLSVGESEFGGADFVLSLPSGP